MLENLKQLQDKFEPITLDEMDGVKLLDRTDTKFLFHASKLDGVLTEMMKHYRLLEIEGARSTDYESLYFDTDDFALYTRHHNGKLNRYKVRYRKYLSSGQHYFEIKFKNNKGRTQKSRIKDTAINTVIRDKAKAFLEENSPLLAQQLKPALWVYYTRMTFVSKNLKERLTMDLNLKFKREGEEAAFENLVIAELKQDKASGHSAFNSIMRMFHIQSNSMSKYSLGIVKLVPDVKKNNFKPKLLTLKKILYAS